MTPEQRIAISEACGWKRMNCPAGKIPWGAIPDEPKTWWFVHQLPDYLNDLNAIWQAVLTLNEQQRRDWALWLTELTCEGTYFPRTYDELFPIITGTAEQWSEAFLRTIGKWET